MFMHEYRPCLLSRNPMYCCPPLRSAWPLLTSLTPLFFSLQAILLSSDGQNLVTGGDNGVVEVWQACDFKQLYIYPGCDAGIRAMDLSHDQRWNRQTLIIICPSRSMFVKMYTPCNLQKILSSPSYVGRRVISPYCYFCTVCCSR